MKIFHFTMHNGCFHDIKNMINDLDSSIDLTSENYDNKSHESFIINNKKADELWEKYKDKFLNNDIILFSDGTPLSWCVLKNLDKLNKNQKVILWIVMKFDYANENNLEYYNLLNSVKEYKNLYFLYSNKFEKYYLNQIINTDTSNEFFLFPYGKRNKKDYNCKNINFDGLYVMSYQNETEFYPLTDNLNQYKIKYSQKKYRIDEKNYCGPFEIKNCEAILHIPYAWGTIALAEYTSLKKTFILPSIKWLAEHYSSYPIWFQTSKDLNLIEKYSMWYSEIYKNCFIYFDNILDINDILKNKTLIEYKSNNCLNTAKKIQKDNLILLNKILYEKI